MSAELTSIIATAVNIVLAILKAVAGIMTGSAALLAGAVDSGLDILSSLITFLGIRTAKKPSTEKYPYGFHRAEVLAGAIVSVIVGVSGFWIIYEGIESYLSNEIPEYSYVAIGFMVFSVIANEVMARLKFKVGNETNSISLVADAEHSRADVVSSAGVLLALILIPYISWIDSVVAVLVGIYIIREAFNVGKEAVDSLIDVADPESEAKIREVVKKQGIEVKTLKTRKIGSALFAEMTITLDAKLSVNEAANITDNLESILDKEIEPLRQVVISVDSHDTSTSAVYPSFGRKLRTKKGIKKIGPDKKGIRKVYPVDENGKKVSGFGTRFYKIEDVKNGKIIQKDTIQNPYWTKSAGHGIKFLKSVSADEFISVKLGAGAKENLKSNGIKYKTSKE